jgi:hypothetical protein
MLNATYFSRVIDTQVADLGFDRLHVEAPYREPGLFLSDSKTALVARATAAGAALVNVFAAAPRMLVLLQHASAALPDSWFADRCGVTPAAINRITAAIDAVTAREQGDIPSVGCTFYAEGRNYQRLFAHAPALLEALAEAREALPKAWKGFGDEPVDLLAEIDATLSAARATPKTNAFGL